MIATGRARAEFLREGDICGRKLAVEAHFKLGSLFQVFTGF